MTVAIKITRMFRVNHMKTNIVGSVQLLLSSPRIPLSMDSAQRGGMSQWGTMRDVELKNLTIN